MFIQQVLIVHLLFSRDFIRHRMMDMDFVPIPKEIPCPVKELPKLTGEYSVIHGTRHYWAAGSGETLTHTWGIGSYLGEGVVSAEQNV